MKPDTTWASINNRITVVDRQPTFLAGKHPANMKQRSIDVNKLGTR